MGANWRSVIPALAKAAVLHREGAKAPKARLDQAAAAATAAFHVCPNLQLLVDVMLAHPPEELQQRCPLTPGTWSCLSACNGGAAGQHSSAATSLHCRWLQLRSFRSVLTHCPTAHPPTRPPALLIAGVPIKPMLAKICEGFSDAVRQLRGAPFIAEHKYDGMRAQVHLAPGGQVGGAAPGEGLCAAELQQRRQAPA